MATRLDEAVELSRAIAAARWHHGFINAVRSFLELLREVPDGALADWPGESLAALRILADEAIETIEKRISGHDRSEEELAMTVYKIREALENISTWERHFKN